MQKMLLVLLLLFSSELRAKDFGTQGTVYPIKEKSFLEQIKVNLQKAKESGRLDELQKQMQESAVQTAKRPKAIDSIRKASMNRSWFYDPSITLKTDLRDQNGQIFQRAGTVVNPLDKISLSKILLFIDGDDAAQVRWALSKSRTKKAKIILVRGTIIDLMQKQKVRFYFDQGGVLVKRFNIEAFPAIVEQQGRQLKVGEVLL